MTLTRDHAAAVVMIASSAGFALVQATWHTALGVPVRGIDLEGHQGLVYGLASLAAALLAGYRVLARGALAARPIALASMLAVGAVGHYLWTIHRARGVILDTLRDVGERLPDSLASGTAPGAWAAGAAASLSLAASLFILLRGARESAFVDGAPARR